MWLRDTVALIEVQAWKLYRSGNREEERNRIEKYGQNGSRSRGEFKGCFERIN